MIINNHRRFIYLHVPKTAGTTVSTELHSYSTPIDLDLGGVINNRASSLNELWHSEWGLEKHTPARGVKNKLPKSIWRDYFKFAFVRNPFARTYSAFHFHQRHKALDGILDAMDFEQYVRSDLFKKLTLQGSKLQSEFLSPLNEIDFIGRQETLQRDLAFVRSMIERRRVSPKPLKRLNKSTEVDAWKHVSDEAKDIMRTILEQDFYQLGYNIETGEIADRKAIGRKSVADAFNA